MADSTLHDPEFGDIAIRRSPRARAIKVSVAPNGRLRASMPPLTPVFLLKRMLAGSRAQIRSMIAQSTPSVIYKNGDQIGKSHMLVINHRPIRTLNIHRADRQLLVELPENTDASDSETQRAIRDEIIKILRREAKAYLPRRLAFLAEKHGFSYDTVRFSHASSRWGSCSSNGTISLNIALMKLPFELIDYVLVHELSHTRQMNHSDRFWTLVAKGDPDYKAHRRTLKAETPTI